MGLLNFRKKAAHTPQNDLHNSQESVPHGNTEIVSEKAGIAPHDVEAGHEQTVTGHGDEPFHFDPEVEKRLRRKIDLHVVPTVALIYLFCFIDRANIGNARLAGFEKDLALTGNDYNVVLSIFYISYILFEIPANLFVKFLGPGWALPFYTVMFGAISIATGYCHTKAQICGVRFLLGLFEAGMLPGIAYYLSRWYRANELSFRLALYLIMAPLAGAFGGLLASGILKLDGPVLGTTRWRMIFAIEGWITIGLGLIAFLTLTDRPATARWLTAEEKELAIARVRSERVGVSEVLDTIDTKKVIRGIMNPNTLIVALIFLLNNITVQGLAFFTPTIVASIYPKATVIQQQLRTVPPYAVGGFFTLLVPFIAWRINKRVIFFIIASPIVMVGYIMFLASHQAPVRYGATFLVAGASYTFGVLTNAHVAANVVSDTARSAAIGTNVMFGNIGGLIATWSYLPKDKNARVLNGLNLAANGTILCLSIFLYTWMHRSNKKLEKRNVEQELAGLSQQEIEDLDWKHPGFRWKP